MPEDAQYKVRLGDGQEFGPASIELIEQWAREGRISQEALLVPEDGSPLRSVFSEPGIAAILQAPPTAAQPAAPTSGSEYSGVIPYRNGPALVSYYLGLFSLLPLIGLLFAIPALVLGIIGLRRRAANPEIKGSAHAWIGIILGALCTIGWGFCIVLGLVYDVSNW